MAGADPLGISGQTILDKYRIERMVGEGGFAVVYRAEHTIWRQPVAIKFFTALAGVPADQHQALQEAFINEGALLSELSTRSANIVQARDIGTYTAPNGDWVPFMVLEWLEGRPLADILDDEQARRAPGWSVDQVVRLLGPIASALDVAHQRGIAHRDVKPGNLFVLGGDPHAPGAVIKLLDFGVAKMMSEHEAMQVALAKTGQSLASFTPQYGAPEQFSRRHGPTGPWTDVFALALVAVELLTGKVALNGDDVVQLAVSCGDATHRPTPRGLGAWVPDEVEAVFERALRVNPAERYARAGEFWRALATAAGLEDVASGLRTTPASAPPSMSLSVAQTALAPSTSVGALGSDTSSASLARTAGAARRPFPTPLVAGVGLLVALGLGVGVWALTRGASPSATTAASASSAVAAPVPRPPAPRTWSESRVASSSWVPIETRPWTTRSRRTTSRSLRSASIAPR